MTRTVGVPGNDPLYTRVSTGVSGLDKRLRGGLYQGSTTLVCGAFGTGKTNLGLQFLLGAADRDETGLYVKITDNPERPVFLLKGFRERYDAAERRGRIRFARTTARDSDSLFEEIINAPAERRPPSVAVIDGVHFTAVHQYRALVPLVQFFKRRGITALATYGVPQNTGRLDDYAEKLAVLCDTVFMLANRYADEPARRTLSVLKMRGSAYGAPTLPLRINDDGITVPARRPARTARRREKAVVYVPYSLNEDRWTAYFRALANRLEKRFPGYAVETATGSARRTGPLLAEPGTAVVCAVLPADRLPELARRDLLLPVADLVDADPAAAYRERALDGCRYRGVLYGLPRLLGARTVFCDRTLLEKHGLPLPGTWEELARTARAVLAREKRPGLEGLILPSPLVLYRLYDLFTEFLWQSGGTFAGDGPVPFEKAAARAIGMLREFCGPGGVVAAACFSRRYQDSLKQLAAGNGVFAYDCRDMPAYLRRQPEPCVPDLVPCRVSDAYPAGVPRTIINQDALAVPRATRHPRLAAAMMTLLDDYALNGKLLAATGMPDALNTFRRYADDRSADPAPDAGVFMQEQQPSERIAHLVTHELRSVLAAGKAPATALDRIREHMRIYRQRPRYTGIIARAVGYIEANYDRPVELPQIADALAISKRHLNRVFRIETGTTCIDYLIGLRMKRAQELLEGTGYTVSEIARMVGYTDQNYFSRLFRKRFGIPPTSLRQRTP